MRKIETRSPYFKNVVTTMNLNRCRAITFLWYIYIDRFEVNNNSEGKCIARSPPITRGHRPNAPPTQNERGNAPARNSSNSRGNENNWKRATAKNTHPIPKEMMGRRNERVQPNQPQSTLQGMQRLAHEWAKFMRTVEGSGAESEITPHPSPPPKSLQE